MEKNLKGKETGKGICQKKNGTFLARFVGARGKRMLDAIRCFEEDA